MPSSLKSWAALFGLLGAFMIPVAVSGLRGLTHVVSCEAQAATPFTMTVHKDGPPEVTSSQRLTRGATEQLCGGLELELRARGEAGLIDLIVSITNNTESLWQGTVQLSLEGTTKLSLPVDIGAIAAGSSGIDTVELQLAEGTTEVQGTLLIGP